MNGGGGAELVVQFGAELKAFEAGIQRVIARLNEVESVVGRTAAAFNKISGSSNAAVGDINKLVASLDRNKQALDKNSDAVDKLNATMSRSRTPIDQTDKSITGVIGSLRGLLGGYLSVQAAWQGGKMFVENAVEVGRYQKILETASGSQEAYAKNTRFLESVANEYRLNVLELGKSFAQLTVATKGTSLEGANTEKLFRATAAAASALQLSTSDVNGTFRAFIQMVSKGNVQAEELRGQLGERLVGAFNMAAKAMGVSTAELNKMLKDGKVLASDLLPKLAEEMQRTFGPAAIQGSQSLGNNLEYAKGQAKLLFAEFAQNTGIVGWVNDWAKGLGAVAQSLRKAREEVETKPKDPWDEIKSGIGLSWGGFGRAFFTPGANTTTKTTKGVAEDRKANWESRRLSDLAAIKGRIDSEAESRLRLELEAEEKARKAKEAKIVNLEKVTRDRLKAQRDAWALEDAQLQYERTLKSLELAQQKLEKASGPLNRAVPLLNRSLPKVDTAFDPKTVFKDLYDRAMKMDPAVIDANIKFRISAQTGNQAFADLSNRLEELKTEFKNIVAGFATDFGVSIGEALGTAISNIGGAEEANRKIGEIFGNLISNLGKALIAYGITAEEVKIALKSLNGWAAIAAGVVAVAAGTALKTTMNKQTNAAASRFWTGGIVSGPGGIDRVPAMLTAGEMVLNGRQQTNLFRMLNGNYGSGGQSIARPNSLSVDVSISGNLRGKDIYVSGERERKSRGYFGS